MAHGDMTEVVRNDTLPVTALLSDVSGDLDQVLLDSRVRFATRKSLW